MFYDQLIKICNLRNVKPSPVLKELGLSSGNLKRWESGANVNYDTLQKLSEYFDVPVDYFFEDNDAVNSSINVIDSGNSFKYVFNVLKSHPDFVVSLMQGGTLSVQDLSKISKYLNCSPDYLVKNSSIENSSVPDYSVIPAKDLILGILSKVPASKEYNYLQVRISTIITSNLAKKNITMEKLIEIKLAEKKIRNLYDASIASENKKGLNFSDLVRISEAFNVSYDFMLTGIGD